MCALYAGFPVSCATMHLEGGEKREEKTQQLGIPKMSGSQKHM